LSQHNLNSVTFLTLANYYWENDGLTEERIESFFITLTCDIEDDNNDGGGDGGINDSDTSSDKDECSSDDDDDVRDKMNPVVI